MYLKSVKFLSDHRCFKEGDCFDMAPVTLLVGDQGCGKSTLLELLGRNDPILDIELTKRGQQGVDTFYFDSEKMNPRINDPNLYARADGTNKGIGFGAALGSRFTSHGETLKAFTVDALNKAENCVAFLDEPESGLSLRSQYGFLREVKDVTDRDVQLIIATHSLLLIQCFYSVLSLEHRRWMPVSEFIDSQKQTSKEDDNEPE